MLSRRRALTVDMIRKIGAAWKIPADLLVRSYKTERATCSQRPDCASSEPILAKRALSLRSILDD